MIRVLIVDDSAVTREYLAWLLRQDGAIEVVGTARDGAEGVAEAVRLRPDVILMDAHMPRVDGYEATRRIMESCPMPIVICSASLAEAETSMSFEALQAGALTIVDKPAGPGQAGQTVTACRLVETVKLMSEVRVIRRWRRGGTGPAPPHRAEVPARPPSRIGVVAIGASTGGPPALAELLGALPPSLGAPVLIVQHIAPGFIGGLAEWLGRQTALRVKVAEAREPTRAGTVYLAPDGLEMGITGDSHIRLEPPRSANGLCPSVHHLFSTVAQTFGPAAVGVLLTGMGQDGVEGLRRLQAVGAVTVAQDEPSSVVFGMPGAAVAAGVANHVLAPDQIALLIRSAVPGGGGRG